MWRSSQAEYVQGTNSAVQDMQRVTHAMGQQRQRQVFHGTTASWEVMDEETLVKGGDIMESSNTANNARTYCFEECCAHLAMDLCVESVATEVTRSNKISRAGWTDEERAAGRVLVVGDGSTPSQVAMEVEGEIDVNREMVTKQPRGKKNRSKQHANNWKK
jgi:hypothetical protein